MYVQGEFNRLFDSCRLAVFQRSQGRTSFGQEANFFFGRTNFPLLRPPGILAVLNSDRTVRDFGRKNTMRSRRWLPILSFAVGTLVFGLSHIHGQDDIDFNKARQIRQRILNGEAVTQDERAYFEKAKQARQGNKGKRPPDNQPPIGLKPLTEMTAKDNYKGEDGGLYGKGRNEPPQKHLENALRLSKTIQPLNAQGKPGKDGRIGLVSIGMSNTTQEFSTFLQLANDNKEMSSHIVLVDGAQGGMEAQAWAEMAPPWEGLDQRLKKAGVTEQQVQVIWMKQARRSPASLGEFPKHADEMNGHMVLILHKLQERFPNLKIVYLSSRIYAGYARSNLNPEPYAYESAFAVRQLIQRQINGDKSLNYDASKGKVQSPLLLWGPYLWADGENGRTLDDLIWTPDDFAQDGTHPSPSGRRKVAEQLLHFFKTDSTTKEWFLANASNP